MGHPVDDERLQAHAAAFIKEHRLPGAALGVVIGHELVWSTGVGFADVAARRSPDATTLFRIGSITKTFTGTAIMQLRAAGRLGLDDAAVAYLPELERAQSPFGPISTVTIRRLLSHESGLASNPPGTDLAALLYEARPLSRASEIATVIPPHTQHKYSNLGYQLLGEVIARVSRKPYPRYVQEEILVPLGMLATSFQPLPPGPLRDLRAVGYNPRLFSDELEPAPEAPEIWAEGGLWSSVGDLARWVGFQLGAYGALSRDDAVLDATARRAMHTPRYLGDSDDWAQARGISWNAVRREGVTWAQHSGGICGFTCDVCFDPKTGVGAVALVNGMGDAPALAMGLAHAAREMTLRRAPSIVAPKRMPLAWRSLLGLYVNEYGTVRLEWRDGELTLVDPANPAWRPILAPTDDQDVFVIGPGCGQSGEQARFRRLRDGRVASVMLASATLRRLEPVSTEDEPTSPTGDT